MGAIIYIQENRMNIVLHICCGVCAAGTVKTLTEEGHRVTGFFYNPNIHPEEEYRRRLETARLVAQHLDFPLFVGEYETGKWSALAGPLKNEPEGGARCAVCFRMRLEKTFEFMQENGADAFASTLTISPHKQADTVNRIGKEAGGDMFLARDFKKKDGFKRAMQMARQWELYRQDYCGCIYSMGRRGP
jgi:predicted adenine nucleotide alpha hydrolase (AANH) superfamily ATPase